MNLIKKNKIILMVVLVLMLAFAKSYASKQQPVSEQVERLKPLSLHNHFENKDVNVNNVNGGYVKPGPPSYLYTLPVGGGHLELITVGETNSFSVSFNSRLKTEGQVKVFIASLDKNLLLESSGSIEYDFNGQEISTDISVRSEVEGVFELGFALHQYDAEGQRLDIFNSKINIQAGGEAGDFHEWESKKNSDKKAKASYERNKEIHNKISLDEYKEVMWAHKKEYLKAENIEKRKQSFNKKKALETEIAGLAKKSKKQQLQSNELKKYKELLKKKEQLNQMEVQERNEKERRAVDPEMLLKKLDELRQVNQDL